jgi:ISXO2-like transposase domain
MLANVQQKTIQPIIQATVARNTRTYTDEYDIYARLEGWGYRHKAVCHGRGEYARDDDGDGFREVHVSQHHGRGLVAAAVLAAAAPGHLAREAAALPRLLRPRAQRTASGQSPPRRTHRRPGRMTLLNTPDPD